MVVRKVAVVMVTGMLTVLLGAWLLVPKWWRRWRPSILVGTSRVLRMGAKAVCLSVQAL